DSAVLRDGDVVALLLSGGNVLEVLVALVGEDDDRVDRSAFDLGHRLTDLDGGDVDLSAHHGGQRRRAAVEGHLVALDVCFVEQQQLGQLAPGADTRGAVGQVAAVGGDVVDGAVTGVGVGDHDVVVA